LSITTIFVPVTVTAVGREIVVSASVVVGTTVMIVVCAVVRAGTLLVDAVVIASVGNFANSFLRFSNNS